MKKSIIAAALLLTAGVTNAATISMSFDADQFVGEEGESAQGAFLAAAAFWENLLLDDVVVDLDINFSQLDEGVLGGASSTREVYTYDSVVDSILADATSTADQMVVNDQSFACDFDQYGLCDNVFKEDGGVDSDNSNDNAYMSLTTANAKALGLEVDPDTVDGNITFNSDFNFDYDPSDGITSGMFDFVGIAIHEIGHTLGFVSGVDIVDQNPDLGLDNFAYISTLDLFRFSEADGLIDMTPGVESYFSLDGGVTELIGFSTGVNSGDGRQASHFEDNVNAGIMDPTFSPGERGVLSEYDVLAFDVIGWDIAQASTATSVDAPTSGILMLSGLGMLFLRNRRRK